MPHDTPTMMLPSGERHRRTGLGITWKIFLTTAGVVVLASITIAFDVRWLTAVLAYGFVARVLTGPRLSPLCLLVTRVIVAQDSRDDRCEVGGRRSRGEELTLDDLPLDVIGAAVASHTPEGMIAIYEASRTN